MRTKSGTGQNSTAVLVPEIAPQSPWRVTHVKVLPGYRLQVIFMDGLEGAIDMSTLVHSPAAGVFAPLSDPRIFATVQLENGTVSWPGELDLAPDAMYAAIREHGEWVL